MSRTQPVPVVGFPLGSALLCPNDDTVYDAARWRACPTCQNEERVFLSRLLGMGAGRGVQSRGVRVGGDLGPDNRLPDVWTPRARFREYRQTPPRHSAQG